MTADRTPNDSRARARRASDDDGAPAGLTAGTVVLTMDGAMPVEFLCSGDRIITRAGMRVLRRIDTPAPRAFRLEFDHPQVIYADGRPVHAGTCSPAPA